MYGVKEKRVMQRARKAVEDRSPVRASSAECEVRSRVELRKRNQDAEYKDRLINSRQNKKNEEKKRN